MTYVSRKTRIIVSRWSDECDAEYTLRACRKRSDGRLKRHASCDDFRAWMNDNCIRHEYLVDFMSDGEFLGKPPFRLYGRFIPVPILFKLMQKTKVTDDDESERNKNSVKGSKSETGSVRFKSTSKVLGEYVNSNSGSQLEKPISNTRLQWEKTVLERRLCHCSCLLNRALKKLERIDYIVGYPCDQTNNTDAARNEEIQNAFYDSKLKCNCTSRKNTSENLFPSRSYVKKLKDSAKCSELLRKISGLKEKLKKIQECRDEISLQIRASQKRTKSCASSNQVTELYSRREQAHIKRLQKKLEKLISEKGKLLSEMYQTLSCLNSIKKASRSSMSFCRNKSKTSRISADFNCERARKASGSCRCPCSEHVESTDSDKIRYSDSSSGECDMNRGFSQTENLDCDMNNDSEAQDVQSTCADGFPDEKNYYFELCSGDDEYKQDADGQRENESCYSNRSSGPEVYDSEKKTKKNEGNDEKTEEKNASKKSKVSFFCPQPTCKRTIDTDDLSAYEQSLSPQQQAVILGVVKSIESRRPTTSPTTKRERNAVVLEENRVTGSSRRGTSQEYIPERQTKSETTMQEFERTLQNYEQRLNQVDSLECKVEDLKHKSLAASQLKQNLERLRAEMKRQKAAEREKSNREITKLCSENWELKRHVQQLTAKFEAQCRKIQSLRSTSMLKEREMECEAEELKKELSEYRDRFEHQRKCISKWESVVAVQRTEIENLMNHIRKLTTMKEDSPCGACQPWKNVQRSRSYSPDMKTRGATSRSKPSMRNYRPSEEDEDSRCCCHEHSPMQEEGRRRGQQRGSDRVYCSLPPTRGTQWCN